MTVIRRTEFVRPPGIFADLTPNPGYAVCHFAAHACTRSDRDTLPHACCHLTPLQGQSRVVELNDAGWKAIHDGYSDKAAKLFAEALTLRPNDPVLLMGAGVAAHERGNQKEAMARLTRALELNPGLAQRRDAAGPDRLR